MRGRQFVGSVFVAALYGIALSQMITTFRQAVPTLSPTAYDLVLPIVFVLTSSRFVIGHAFHFAVDKSDWAYWSLDAGFVFIMSFITVLLGLTASVEASRTASVGFVTLLASLYITDLVFLSIVMAQNGRKRKAIHRYWFAINTGATVLLLLVWLWSIDFYSPFGLTVVLFVNLGAFALDTSCSLALHEEANS